MDWLFFLGYVIIAILVIWIITLEIKVNIKYNNLKYLFNELNDWSDDMQKEIWGLEEEVFSNEEDNCDDINFDE